MITQEKLKDVLDYNEETGDFTWKIRIAGVVEIGDVAGCKVAHGYIKIIINKEQYYAHRLAWLYVHGVWPENQIDHINHDRSDNRLENLRCVTRQGNNRNTKLYKNNKSGVTGVARARNFNRWIAKIKVSGKEIVVGSFKDKFEAICARKSAEVKYGFHENHGR